MGINIEKKRYFTTSLCIALCISFLSGCGDDDEDEIINPKNTVISSQGGMALSADGNVTVEIPAGAVSSDTTIIVGESASMPPGTVGKAYQFGPEGFKFQKPVTIFLKYNPDNVPPGAADDELALGRESSGKWEKVSGCAVDPSEYSVSGSVMGFSSYGIFWPNAPTNSVEYWNLINNKACKLLDNIREFNIGTYMISRGLTKDFTQEFDPEEEEYSDQEIDCFLYGLQHVNQSLAEMEDTIKELEELEAVAMGNAAPARISVERPEGFVDKLNNFVYGNFIYFYKSWTNAIEAEKTAIMRFVGNKITSNLNPLDRSRGSVCQDVECLEESFRYVFKDAYDNSSFADTDDACSEYWMTLRNNAFQMINDAEDKEVTNLGRDLERCGFALRSKLALQAGGNAALEGEKVFKDTFFGSMYKKAGGLVNQIADSIQRVEIINNAINAWSNAPSKFHGANLAPASGLVRPADAVIYLVPHDETSMPILVAATVAENGVMEIPEPYVGSYRLFFYSSGNYPVCMENVNISESNWQIQIPEPQPLPGISNPLFSAMTSGNPMEQLDPPPPRDPYDQSTENLYRITYKASILSEDIMGFAESRFEGKATFEFVNNKALIEVPYTMNVNMTSKDMDDGSTIEYIPSSFSMQGSALWKIDVSIDQDNQTCYSVVSVKKLMEETQIYSGIWRDKNGVIVMENKDIEMASWPAPVPSNKDLGCGELPLTWELPEPDAVEMPDGWRYEKNITVTIEEI